MAKRRKRRILDFDPFGTWERIPIQNRVFWQAITQDAKEPDAIFVNRLYQVLVYREYVQVEGWPVMHWLTIKRRDKSPVHDWRDLQRIKNDLIGTVHEAVELYPAESRLIDTSNQHHLYVLADPTLRFPFGFTVRAVVEAHDGGPQGSKQRPWPKGLQPADAMTVEEFNEACDQRMGPVATQDRCPTCGGDMRRAHICGAGRNKDGKPVRFPMYTDRADDHRIDGPDLIEEGDK